MSWDVVLLRLPLSARSLGDLPRDYVPPPFGSRERVRGDLERVARGLEWVVATFGVLREEDYVIEVDLGPDDPVGRVLLHVVGSNASLGVVSNMAGVLGGTAVDCETERAVDFAAEEASSGLDSWREREAVEVAVDRESRKLMEESGEIAFPVPPPKSPRN